MTRAITARPILPRSFYERDTITVARQLLGQILVHSPSSPEPACAGRIVEVEAYVGSYEGEPDRAAHSHRGLTSRTRVIFGPAGHAYVYLVYGLHECLNIVAEPGGVPGCVLIRALEPVSGVEVMRQRRPAARREAELCSGPGNLTRAMAVSLQLYGADLPDPASPLTVRAAPSPAPAEEILSAPRVGIRHCADWPLRFYLAGHPSVSRYP